MSNALLATQLLLQVLNQAATIGGTLAKAQAEQRDLTDAELDALVLQDDIARDKLQDAIDAKSTPTLPSEDHEPE